MLGNIVRKRTHPINQERRPQTAAELQLCIIPNQERQADLSCIILLFQRGLDFRLDELHRLVLNGQRVQTSQDIVPLRLTTSCVIPTRRVGQHQQERPSKNGEAALHSQRNAPEPRVLVQTLHKAQVDPVGQGDAGDEQGQLVRHFGASLSRF